MAIEPDLVAEAAVAIREEIVRQYRDQDRQRCKVGVQFWEENVQPMLLAEAALRVYQQLKTER